jgi:hypothetical protein
MRRYRAGCRSGNPLYYYPGGASFESRSVHQLSGMVPRLQHGRFLPNPFQFIYHPTIWHSRKDGSHVYRWVSPIWGYHTSHHAKTFLRAAMLVYLSPVHSSCRSKMSRNIWKQHKNYHRWPLNVPIRLYGDSRNLNSFTASPNLQ